MKLTKRASRVVSVVVGAIALALCLPAQAQEFVVVEGPGPAAGGFFGGGPGFAGSPASVPMSAEQLDGYSDLLELDDVQNELVQDLYAGYIGELARLAQSHQDTISKLREEFEKSRDHTVFLEKMPKLVTQLRSERDALTKTLFEDIQLLLTPDQEAKWPAFERARRRDTLLPQGFMSGESVDLVSIAKEVGIDRENEDVGFVLDAYEKELDKALIERSELKDIMASFDGAMDFEKMLERAEERSVASKKIRDVNQKFFSRLSGTLDAETAARLDEAFQTASFPQVYRKSYVDRALDIAEALDDLTPEQKASLARIRADHAKERARADAAWAREIRQSEDDGDGGAMTFGGGGGQVRVTTAIGPNGQIEETDLDKARKARRQLDDETVEKIRSVLGEDQVARLPERKRFHRLPNGVEMPIPSGGNAVFITEEVSQDGTVRRAEVRSTTIEPAPDGGVEEIDVIVLPDAEVDVEVEVEVDEEDDGTDA